ncbi:MAG: radical SAM protein [Desulfobacteraceae bacterium]|nr:radical SAM protein [Desulfobacteraceae bacterium]
MTSTYVHELRAKLTAANLAEYGDKAGAIHWAAPATMAAATTRRAELLQTAAAFLTQAAKQTKPHFGELSPGCRVCASGQWSCLFINGRCNCRCFYCPTSQDEISVPTTNRVPFATAADYAKYVRRFGFTGASISGGEPLLTFERTIDYIETVRRELGPQLHIWLYTNGTLATRERLAALQAAGLNEIRFDLSAVDYNLSKVEMAAGLIECVTVEIPAIPEDADLLAALLPSMAAAGVKHLNLHQLRLTPHNLPHLTARDYSFLHGESVTVLESELTALQILLTAGEKNICLPVNYCSFVYKRRYQQAATRRRNAGDVLKGWESITENGFIRCLTLNAAPEALAPMLLGLQRQDPAKQRWAVNTNQDRLQFHESLWPFIDFNAGRLLITYAEAVLAPNISYRCAFKEVRLDSGKKIFIEKRPVRIDLPLAPAERPIFEARALGLSSSDPSGESPGLMEILSFELIAPGLQDYF